MSQSVELSEYADQVMTGNILTAIKPVLEKQIKEQGARFYKNSGLSKKQINEKVKKRLEDIRLGSLFD